MVCAPLSCESLRFDLLRTVHRESGHLSWALATSYYRQAQLLFEGAQELTTASATGVCDNTCHLRLGKHLSEKDERATGIGATGLILRDIIYSPPPPVVSGVGGWGCITLAPHERFGEVLGSLRGSLRESLRGTRCLGEPVTECTSQSAIFLSELRALLPPVVSPLKKLPQIQDGTSVLMGVLQKRTEIQDLISVHQG